jgi:glutathione S-transferase
MLAGRPFLTGDRLSIADIPIGTSLYRYFWLDLDRPDLPNVTACYRRMQQRPAYYAHAMVPFGELQGRLYFRSGMAVHPTHARGSAIFL